MSVTKHGLEVAFIYMKPADSGIQVCIQKRTASLDISVPQRRLVQDLQINQKANEHATIKVVGLIDEFEKDTLFKNTDSQTPITVTCFDGVQEMVWYKGIITNIQISYDKKGQNYLYTINGASFTYNMDLELKKRSFPDPNMTYDDLITTIIPKEALFNSSVESHERKLDGFILQYLETDWEIIKRLASHFNSVVVADITQDKICFYFGIPDRESGEEKDICLFDPNYRMIREQVDCSLNGVVDDGIAKKEMVYYEMVSECIFDIGENFTITFYKKSLDKPGEMEEIKLDIFIYESVMWLQGDKIYNKYLLRYGGKTQESKVYNTKISGVSLKGTVLARQYDKLRVHLQIDKDYKEKYGVDTPENICTFPYTTMYTAEGNTGWYCMPEEGDTVGLYFPMNNEAEAVVVNSIRQNDGQSQDKGEGEAGGESDNKPKNGNTLKVNNPDIKFFRTKFGKELMFSEEEIVITGKDNEILLKLNEEEGVTIHSKLKVNIYAEKDITISSAKGKVEIAAEKGIDLQCQQSSISMNGITTIKGKEIKTN